MGTRVGGDSASTTVAALNVVWPAGVAAGDIAVVISGHSNASTTTTPSGFTSIKTTTATAAFVEVFVKTCAGTETGNLAVNISTASKHYAHVEVWRGVVLPTAAEVTIGTGTADTATTSAVPAVTKAGTIWWITGTVQANSTPPTAFTQPAGTTMSDSAFTTGGGAKVGAVAYTNASESDGSVGSGSWTRNNSVAIDWANITVALADAITRVTKTSVTTWDTIARVNGTLPASWDTIQRINKTSVTTWDLGDRAAKTSVTTWDVIARPTKTSVTTWDTLTSATRVDKTSATTWDTLFRGGPKASITTYDVRSMISEVVYPAFAGHRGADPGPEETMFAYSALYAQNPNFIHEGDFQLVSTGQVVFSHDDTIDRMYSSGPVSTGNITSMTKTQWDATNLRRNSGFTGAEEPTGDLVEWAALFGPGTGTPAVALFEVKTGTPVGTCIGALNALNLKGQVIVNCDSLSDAQASVAAGYETCYQTETPTFSQFTSNGFKHLSISMAAMTGTIGTNAHAAGVKVWIYTVNSVGNKDTYAALGGDAFISNKPLTVSEATHVTKTQVTSWDTRGRVNKTSVTTWDDRARGLKTQATTWDAVARVTKTSAASWDTQIRVSKTQVTSYDLSFRDLKTQATTWDMDSSIIRIDKTSVTTWDIELRLAKTSATSWDLRVRLAKSSATGWDVFAVGVIGAAKVKTWQWSQWVEGDLKVWDGDSWVTPEVKTWSGSAWV